MLRTSKLPTRTCQPIGRDHPGQGDLFSYVAPNQSGANWEVTSDLPIWLFNQTIFSRCLNQPKTFGSIFKGAGINFKQICRCRRRHVFHVGHMWQFGMHPSWDSTTRWVFANSEGRPSTKQVIYSLHNFRTMNKYTRRVMWLFWNTMVGINRNKTISFQMLGFLNPIRLSKRCVVLPVMGWNNPYQWHYTWVTGEEFSPPKKAPQNRWILKPHHFSS